MSDHGYRCATCGYTEDATSKLMATVGYCVHQYTEHPDGIDHLTPILRAKVAYDRERESA